jgi:hypothetical protein
LADSSVVDQHVQPPPCRDGFPDQPDPVGIVRQIRLHVDSIAQLARQGMAGFSRTA